MKKLAIYLLFTLTTVSTTFAQTIPLKRLSPKSRAERNIQELQGKLLLSDKQKKDLYAMFVDQYSKGDSLRNIKADQSVFKAQMKTSHEKIAAILTADQLVKYNDWITQKRQNAKH